MLVRLSDLTDGVWWSILRMRTSLLLRHHQFELIERHLERHRVSRIAWQRGGDAQSACMALVLCCHVLQNGACRLEQFAAQRAKEQRSERAEIKMSQRHRKGFNAT